MRVLFLLLVLINLSFFYWHAYYASQPRAPAADIEDVVQSAPGVSRLRLLSEDIPAEDVAAVSGTEGSSVSTDRSGGQPIAPVDQRVETCRSIGGFDDRAAANAARKIAQDAGAEVQLRDAVQERPTGYWVYLPPFMSEAQARRQYDILQRAGIDSFIVTEGKYRNAISLGIFSMQHTAAELRDRMVKEGYNPVMDRRYRSETTFWLDVRRRGDPIVTAALWEQLRGAFPSVPISPLDCGKLRVAD